jgi:hypothetical protein
VCAALILLHHKLITTCSHYPLLLSRVVHWIKFHTKKMLVFPPALIECFHCPDRVVRMTGTQGYGKKPNLYHIVWIPFYFKNSE